ncbi:MAG TPA: lipid A export permease/ATP-binding protein MsbA [Burkholderiales bacterium]|nr:lipid A export permease/ATP-binding protein MsbA [Burkholderiales bacterium]
MTNMTSGQLYLRLLRYVARYWRTFLVSILGMVLVAITQAAVPILLKPMLDGSFVNKDPTWIRIIPILIVLLMLVHGIATFVSGYGINWVGNKVVLDLREAMFRKLVQLPTMYYENQISGNLISKFIFDVAQVTFAATSVVTVVIKDGLSILGLLGWMVYLNWKLTAITLIMGPPIMVIIRVISKRLRSMSREVQQAMGEVTQVLQEGIDGHKVVKIFGGQNYESGRFNDRANRVRRFEMKHAAAAAASWPFVQLIAALALALIVYWATLQSAADETTVGGFVSFIISMLMLIAPLKRLTEVNAYLQRGLAAAESVFGLLEQQGEPDEGSIVLARPRGEIRFENVSFTYGDPERLALKDVTLSIQPGETLALVGASGGGKTTFVNLVPRFYHPTRGRILLDGHDLETLKLSSLRDNIALVSQDVMLFNDSVGANIAYGVMGTATQADIVNAATAAHAMEFISELAEGLNTLVGENGVKLSAGQRQRLAIARALLKNAPVLILDEATSALDSESERHVQAALDVLMRGRTTIVIAHRLSTVEKANRIVVLEKGSIAEIGNHQELLGRRGAYAKFYDIQFAR